MRKSVLLASLVLALSLFGGCGIEREKEQEEPITITLWHYYNDEIKAQFDDLVRQFNETVGAEKGIIVDAYSQGGVNELAECLYASAQEDVGSNAMPDIFAAYSDSAYRLDKLGMVANADEYFTEEELAEYRSEFLADGKFTEDGSLKIIPIAKSTELLYINMTAFEEFAAATGASADSLKTWEGLTDTAEKYYNWCQKSFFGIDSMANFMIIATRQLGQDIIKIENGEASFNLPEEIARKIWDVYYVPYIKGYYADNGRFRSDDIKSGLIISFIGSNSSASYFPKAIETGKDTSYATASKVLSYPYFEGKEKYCVQQGAGMVITKGEKRKEQASAEFLKWFTDPEQNVKFSTATAYMPVENNALDYETTIAELGTDDENDVRVQTAQALYKMLDEYTLYASKPFDQSLNVRHVLESSLNNFIEADMEELEARRTAGEEQDMLYEEYTGDGHFEKWYSSLIKEMDSFF